MRRSFDSYPARAAEKVKVREWCLLWSAMINWTELLLGALLGGAVGTATSWYFASRSGQELKREADHLRRLTNILISGMERAGWIKISRDEHGNTKGMVFEITAQSGLSESPDSDAALSVGLSGKLGVSGDLKFGTGPVPDKRENTLR